MQILIIVLLAFYILVAPEAFAAAQELNLTRSAGAIVIDGDVADSGWSKAQKVTAFVEYNRADNVEPPVKTTALLTYDDRALYIAFICDDPNPSAIRAPFVDRDQVLGDQDYVNVILDTANDRRSATVFRVNARGIQTDNVLNDANGSEDFAPDLVFEPAARITETGWSAEMRIPFSSLRYSGGDPQTWGIMLTRNYPRDFRYVMTSAPVPKTSNCFVCHAASLTGLEGLPSGSHLGVVPYATAAREEKRQGGGGGERTFDPSMVADPLRSDTGLDVKWNVSSRLTLDGTLNPDFSQIEADVPQITANTRFALFFPEKRPFFLEGVDLFSMPMRAVYTRSITSPAWGVRATGHGENTSWTLLAAEDRGGGSVVLPGPERSISVSQDFRSLVAVGRVRRSIGKSFAAFLVSDREVKGGGHNRVAGPDFMWRPNGADKVQGQLLFSDTENPVRPDLSPQFDGRSATGHAARLTYNREARLYEFFASYLDYSEHFRADNGLIPFAGLRGWWSEIAGRVYPKKGPVSYFRPFLNGGKETAWEGSSIGFYFEGKYGSSGWASYHPSQKDRVNGKFVAYRFAEAHITAAPARMLPSIGIDVVHGDRVDYAGGRVGRGGSIGVSTAIRPTEHLELAANLRREWLDLDSGRLYDAGVHRLKATYIFNARSLARVIVEQGETERNLSARDGDISFSALYGFRLSSQTALYLGYGDYRLLESGDRFVPERRSVFLKISYAIYR